MSRQAQCQIVSEIRTSATDRPAAGKDPGLTDWEDEDEGERIHQKCDNPDVGIIFSFALTCSYELFKRRAMPPPSDPPFLLGFQRLDWHRSVGKFYSLGISNSSPRDFVGRNKRRLPGETGLKRKPEYENAPSRWAVSTTVPILPGWVMVSCANWQELATSITPNSSRCCLAATASRPSRPVSFEGGCLTAL